GGLFAYVIYPVNWFIITAGEFLAYTVGLIGATLLAVILQVPGMENIPTLGSLLRTLANWITGGVGDQQALTTRSVPISAAAETVIRALEPFLSPGARTNGKPGAEAYESVSV